jgi:hypothetical protein
MDLLLCQVDERHLFVIPGLKGGEIHSALAFLKTPKTQNKSDLVEKWWSSFLSRSKKN